MCGGSGSWIGTLHDGSRRQPRWMPRRSRGSARAVTHALPRKDTSAFTERVREPQHGGIDTGLFCPLRLHIPDQRIRYQDVMPIIGIITISIVITSTTVTG